MNVEKDQAYWEDWDEPALWGIIQQQRKITKTSKKLEMKKLYQVLILDDLADTPKLHKPNGALCSSSEAGARRSAPGRARRS